MEQVHRKVFFKLVNNNFFDTHNHSSVSFNRFNDNAPIMHTVLLEKQHSTSCPHQAFTSTIRPTSHLPSFSRYFYNGLGYKIFVKNNQLLVWIGLTHYTILDIPHSVKVFSKKRRFFIVGSDKRIFNNFIAKLRRIRKIDLYKAKGLSEVKTYKGFIKMKSSKKKQY